MKTRILLIRHATTDMVGKRLAGRMEGIHLNEEGRRQAESLAKRIAHLPLAAIYSSPLERAVETAEPLAGLLHLPIQKADDLVEIDFGQWTNCAIDDLKDQPQFVLFNSFRSIAQIPGGERMNEAQTRVVNCIQGLVNQHTGETIAIVSHSDLIKAAIAHYAGIPLDLFQRIEIDPASVSIIDMYPETVRIKLVNNTDEIQ